MPLKKPNDIYFTCIMCEVNVSICVSKLVEQDMRVGWLVWFVGFYGISTFVGYLTPNPFLCK